jgi:energy-coupling factor transporter ATP-binding protein EcfA2
MKVTILCGISGSGKSTLAKSLGGVVCSADDYFTLYGKYDFNPSKLPEAHAWCLRKFVSAVQLGLSDVVVDNTNTTVAEVAPYAALALAYGHELLIKIILCNVDVAAARNVHGVPRAGIFKMAERIQGLAVSLPPWWPCEEVAGTPLAHYFKEETPDFIDVPLYEEEK